MWYQGGINIEPEDVWICRFHVWLRFGLRLIGLKFVCSFIRLLPSVLSFILPFLAAFGLAVLLNPMVRKFQKKLGWNRKLLSFIIVLIVFSIVSGILALIVYLVGREIIALTQNWERLMGKLDWREELWTDFRLVFPEAILELLNLAESQLTDWIGNTVSVFLSDVAQRAAQIITSLPRFLLGLVVFLMASYFFTADYPYLRIRLFQSVREETCRVLKQTKRVLSAATGGYFKAQILLSSGVFFLLLMGFLAWRQEYAFLLAFGLAVLDFIPLVGAGVALVPWGVVSVAMGRYGDGIWAATLLSVTAVFRRLAEPKIVGEQTGLSPVLSLMSVYVGMNLAGVPGMILGPILTLMVLNLSGLGLFYRLRKDFVFVMEDIFRLFQRD